MEQPIATYRDRRFDGTRVSELLAGRLVVRGTTQLSGEFETSIPLESLDPVFTRLRVRHNAFWGGVWMLLGSFTAEAVLLSGLHIPPESFAPILIGCLGMAGVVLMLATARKVEFIAFKTTAGVHALDLARSGPDAAGLDSFVELLVQQICQARAKNI